MEYFSAEDLRKKAMEIVVGLDMKHIDMDRVHFIRSGGSKSRRVIARIHGMGRIWPRVLGMPPHYIVEVISERYDCLNDEEKEKILLHELLHIPLKFSGGFVCHKGKVTRKRIERLYKQLKFKRAF